MSVQPDCITILYEAILQKIRDAQYLPGAVPSSEGASSEYPEQNREIVSHAYSLAREPIWRQKMEKSGLCESDFLFCKGIRRIADLKKAIMEACTQVGIVVPVMESYNRQAASFLYDIDDFRRIYPHFLNLILPDFIRRDGQGPMEKYSAKLRKEEMPENHFLATGRNLRSI